MRNTLKIAGCVPAYNNESTIAQAVASLKAQTIYLTDVFVVDDGSTDGTVVRAKEAGARVVSLGMNSGRGAARAKAMEEADADLLLSVDGTNVLAPDFLEKCLPWFQDQRVASVYGRITQDRPRSVAERWRGRHLYNEDTNFETGPVDTLITWGVVFSKKHVLEAGGFNRTCRQCEDTELGRRLNAREMLIISDPSAILTTLTTCTVLESFERYWRWNMGETSNLHVNLVARFWWYVLKVMVKRDVMKGDVSCALITLLLPIYCIYRFVRQDRKMVELREYR